MKLPQYFIDRPIFAGVLSIVITLLGAVSMLQLPISEYPEVIPPTIAVNATYPGASPETIAATVAGPLEQQMVGLDGLIYLGSQSTPNGTMQLTLTFKIGTNLNNVLTEVQNRVQIATPRLPEEVRRLGVVAQKATRDLLLVINLDSPDGSLDTLTLGNYARLNVRDQLLRIPGVRDVFVFGSGEYAMRVWLDPEKMAARGLTPTLVAQAIREQNLQVTAGIVGQQPVTAATGFEMTVVSQERLADEQAFRNIVVTRGTTGQLVRLGDVARVELGGNSYSLRGLLSSRSGPNGATEINKTAIALPIIQAPGSNALEVATAVRAKIAELQTTFPPGVRQQIMYDPTVFISESIKSVVHTLIEAIILVVLVVILFLQTWRASLIPLLAVPVSVVGTFAVMHYLGFSINALSLFGLVLAIGIVVDDAIVVVENVERNIALGLNPRDATRQAMREVSGPILATALVLCSVFIPTAFISGLTGRFFQQFALTIAISTAISAFNSLTLSPALAALLLKPHVPGAQPGGLLLGWFFRLFNRFFGAASNGYVGLARRTVRFSIISLLLYGGLVALTVKAFQDTPTSYIPAQDKGFLICIAKLPDGASLDRTEAVIKRVGEIAMQNPAVAGVVQFPGLSINGFTPMSNAGLAFIRLKPWDERKKPGMGDTAVAGALAGPFMGINDALVFVVPSPPVLGLSTTGDIRLYLEDRGSVGLPRLYEATMAVLAGARKRPEISPRIYTNASMGVPRLAVDINRDKAIAQSIRPTEIYDALQGYFGIIYANDFNRFSRMWQVNIQADAPFRLDQSGFEHIKVRNSVGAMVPLASFVTIRETAGPDRATQYNTYPSMDINLAPAQGYTSDQAKAAIEEVLRDTLPREIGYEWTELTYQQILAGNTAFYVFPVCVLLVFLVLAAFYESLILPMAIILIVPMCLLCALGGVWLMHGDNNIMTQIGLVVLVGLACKNAILIVEFAREAEIHQGLDPLAAAMEACRLRLRPILMTSIAFIMGVWPLMTATGAGAELRKATGTAVFFGMIGVTVFGLLLTPVFYVVLRRLTGGHLHKADEET